MSTDITALRERPASREVNFIFASTIESGELIMTDLSGKMVQDMSIKGATNVISNVASLPQGLYFYKLTTDGRQVKAGKVMR